MDGERTFRRIFKDSKLSQSELFAAHVDVCWDGNVIFLECRTATRAISGTYVWSWSTVQSSVHGAPSLGEAVRSAVKMADAFFEAAFAEVGLPPAA